jgi:FkbM family methyltransferase
MISYAQNFEDVTLWRALRDVANGRYVDVGALHPELDSVTKWFYDQGWSGINLEPVPEMFAVIEAARPRDINIQAAAGSASGVADMAIVPDSMGLSSLDISAVSSNMAFSYNLVQVEVRPLRDVLEPFTGQDIHFLKVDAEGTEHDVLVGMDFDRFRPWVVVVEATEPQSQTATAEKWEDLLIASNYQHAYFDGLNEFYVAAERSELARKLAVPPNVFDNFELAATVRERTGREELQRLYLSATDENQRLQGEISRRDTEVARLGEQLTTASSEVARLQSELEQTREALTTTEAQLAAAHDDLARERRRLELSNHRIEELTGQVRGSEAAIVSLSEQLSALAAELKKGREVESVYKKQLDQVLSSRSFRWLAPARRMRAMLLPHRQ